MDTMQDQRKPKPWTLQKFYAVVAAMLLVGVAAPAAAQAGCGQQVQRTSVIPERPWPQYWFDLERIHALSEGDEVRVAVLDTGVDTSHRQLDGGRVLAGTDLLAEPAGAHVDCDSHGTAVASIIAASREDDIGFLGMAPEARILPVRIAERQLDTTGTVRQQEIDPETFAEGIRWAVDNGAQVINASVVFHQNYPAIEDAIREAVDEGVVVVAAAGNVSTASAPYTPFPAAYDGVIGVGAVGLGSGTLTMTSLPGPHVDLLAPGGGVLVATAGGGHAWVDGSSFAAPFVSATAALLLAGTDLTSAEVMRQLLATAEPWPGSREASGHGVVNPYRALTERTAEGEPGAAEPPAEPVVDPAAVAGAERWRQSVRVALAVSIVAAVIGIIAVAGRAAWRRGRTKGWQPTRPPEPEPAATVDAPERLFFTVPTARARR